MKICVVIPVHNRKDFTKSCLQSLNEQTYLNFSTIIVDDGSTDGTSEMIEDMFPDVQLLHGNGNLWWTGGINMGITHALKSKADYIITLNDDTVIPPTFMENMVKWANRKPKAVFGALEVDIHTQKLLYAGQIEKWGMDKSIRLLEQLKNKEKNGIHRVDTFHGRGLWVPKEVFNKIGLFDKDTFPHYMADFDFVYNAHKAGFEVFCNFDAFVYSYPEACGDKENKVQKNISKYYNHLFGVKGGGNLKNFTRYTLKNCPSKVVPMRLFVGYSRRIVGYWLH